MAGLTICTNCQHYVRPFGDLPLVEGRCKANPPGTNFVTGEGYTTTTKLVRCLDKNTKGKCPDYEEKV